MSKKSKILLCTGIGILLVGIILSVTLYFVNITHLDESQINKTYQLEEFNSIDIDLVESDIKIINSNENKVEFTESDSIYHELSYENGILNIKRKSKYHPFEWLFHSKFVNMSMTLYLNESTLNEVDINVVSGKVEIEKINANILDIKSVSGNILLNNANFSDVYIETVSGSIEGDNIKALNKLELESVSGKIELLNSDAKNIEGQTVSGNISLELKSNKIYTIKTISGKINKPENGNNGFCNVETISGNIDIVVIVIE